jgi:hypothetical protein
MERSAFIDAEGITPEQKQDLIRLTSESPPIIFSLAVSQNELNPTRNRAALTLKIKLLG